MTYKELAKLAGVSTSTVSRALSGSKQIGEETAARILRLAEQHGVVRPEYYRAKKNPNIAILVPEISSIYYSNVATGLIEVLQHRGIDPSIYICGFVRADTIRILDTIARDKLADGVISLSHHAGYSHNGLPLVQLLTKESGNHDTVYVDTEAGICDAIAYLRSMGHRSIGFIGEINTETKRAAFVRAMNKLGLVVREEYIYVSDKRFERIGVEAAEHFLRAGDLPTAFLMAYDEIAYGAIETFAAHGVRVPEDVSVIGINDIPSSALGPISLTTLQLGGTEQLAAIALHLLFDQIQHPDTHRLRRAKVECKLIRRKTVCAPKPDKE